MSYVDGLDWQVVFNAASYFVGRGHMSGLFGVALGRWP
jgi:hypothetical protein